AHGRRAGLAAVALRRVLANGLLAVLESPQPPDHPRPQRERDDDRRDGRHRRPERDVPEDVERAPVLDERDEELVQHQPSSPPSRAARAATTRPMRMPREPFTHSASPGATRLRSRATVSSNVLVWWLSARPAARAASTAAAASRPTPTNSAIPAA